MNTKISAVIISKNAERTIGRTLRSLSYFDEVVLLDTGSTDNTMRIAKSYHNVKLFQDIFSGFGKSKNVAAMLAQNDWIFSIDSDEVLTPGLIKSLKQLKPANKTVYLVKRNNFYKKARIKHSGWGNDYLVRIYNRKETAFKEKLVHEHVCSDNLKIKNLNGIMNHFTYQSLSDFSKKREFYSDLFAIENRGKRKSSPSIAFFHALYEFFHTYFLRKGFLDGYLGLFIAVSNAYFTFSKYIKLYEANMEIEQLVEETLAVTDLKTIPG
jgi:glycosyltransferase involved in cell wall biosynthesis